MDLNHIELSPGMVVELYRSSLIENDEKIKKIIASPEIKTSIPVNPDSNQNSWKWLGENRKNILIIVNYPDAVHLPDQGMTFLTGVLAACKLSLADVAILNLYQQKNASYKELLDQFRSKTILLFGVEPADFGLPISFPHFQVQSFINSTFLFAPVLSELEVDKLLKSKLWVCLRRIFSI